MNRKADVVMMRHANSFGRICYSAHCPIQDMMGTTQGRLIHSASLSGYVELVQSLGGDAHALMRLMGLSVRLLDNPETLIPAKTARGLLTLAAQQTGCEDFALRLAAGRSLSNRAPISLVLENEPTPPHATHWAHCAAT